MDRPFKTLTKFCKFPACGSLLLEPPVPRPGAVEPALPVLEAVSLDEELDEDELDEELVELDVELLALDLDAAALDALDALAADARDAEWRDAAADAADTADADEDDAAEAFDALDADACASVSYTHLTLPTNTVTCRSRWSPYH